LTRRRAALGCWLVSIVGSCAPLPEVAADVCGNGIVEAHEDCDTFAPDAKSVCLPKGTAGECHLDCRRRGDGTRPACPSGWGCDAGICRPPTGDFEVPAEYQVGGAASLVSGDFDGDGRADVVSQDPRDALGQAKLRFHYFDEAGALVETRLFPKRVATPIFSDLSGDGRGDLAFTNFNVGVLVGQADRSFLPASFPSYHMPTGSARLVTYYNDEVQEVPAVMVVATLNGVSGFFVPDAASGKLIPKGELPGPLETLVGDPVNGNLFDDPVTSPCYELIYASRGGTTVGVFDTCTRSPTTQEIVLREPIEPRTVELDPPAPIDAAPLVTDVNVDGHMDLLFGAGGKPYVAYGDGRQLSTAKPYRLDSIPTDDVPSAEIAMPLAAADFTGDGIVDFVFVDRIVVSSKLLGAALPRYRIVYANAGTSWTDAKIADLNGNGKLDVVAASSKRLDIDFFSGTGTEHLLPLRIPTDRAVKNLVVGDVDGDQIGDVSFIEAAFSATDGDTLKISFGEFARPPLEPVAVARMADTEQLILYQERGFGIPIIAGSEIREGQRRGVFTLLDGSADRLPFAPLSLTSLTADGALTNSIAFGLTIGAFVEPRRGRVDAMAMGSPRDGIWELWFLPSLERTDSVPVRFAWALDPRLVPARREVSIIVNLAGASGDLDGDGRDETIWAMPADEGRHCGVALVGVDAGATSLVPRGTLVLDDPCPGPQLLTTDVDGDGATDVALLTGAPGAAGRKLVVLWNDGKGGFSSSSATVASAADSPEAFAVLDRVADRPFGLVYVTDQAAMQVSVVGPHKFGTPNKLASMEHGTGITTADVNGDGIVDLVLAASGHLTVLKAQLRDP